MKISALVFKFIGRWKALRGPSIEAGRVYQKLIRNGSRTWSEFKFNYCSDFCPDWVIWTRSSVAIKLKARFTSMSLTFYTKAHINVSTVVKKIVRRTWCLLQRASLSSRWSRVLCRHTIFLFELALISSSFADYSTIFNGNVYTRAKAVVCPLNAEDVSK